MILEIATLGPGFAVDENPDRLGQESRPPPEEMIIWGNVVLLFANPLMS